MPYCPFMISYVFIMSLTDCRHRDIKISYDKPNLPFALWCKRINPLWLGVFLVTQHLEKVCELKRWDVDIDTKHKTLRHRTWRYQSILFIYVAYNNNIRHGDIRTWSDVKAWRYHHHHHHRHPLLIKTSVTNVFFYYKFHENWNG